MVSSRVHPHGATALQRDAAAGGAVRAPLSEGAQFPEGRLLRAHGRPGSRLPALAGFLPGAEIATEPISREEFTRVLECSLLHSMLGGAIERRCAVAVGLQTHFKTYLIALGVWTSCGKSWDFY